MPENTPFSSLHEGFSRFASGLQPPEWVVHELQHRLVLAVNHVLMQEPEAQRRLAARQGKVVRVQWRDFWLQLVITPAGLADLAPVAEHDLLITVDAASPFALGRDLARGTRPPVHIEGDAELAGAVQWCLDNVRWDAEEDLSRLVGDAPAHAAASAVHGIAERLRRFAAGGPFASRDKAGS